MKKNVTLFLTFIIVMITLLTASTIYQANTYPSIVIDPGHGGFDGGATINNCLEKDITLTASLMLGELLEKTGYKVTYTRKKDTALDNAKVKDMQKRLKIINKESTIIYISVHANIYSSNIARGAQTFYNSNNPASALLADYIQEALVSEDRLNKRKAKGITGKYLLDQATSVGCIVELGFMSNEEELKTLTDEKLLEKRCLMIYLGVLKYLQTDIKY